MTRPKSTKASPAIRAAVEKGHVKVVERLLATNDANAWVNEGHETLLLLAVNHDRDAVVKLLLEHGADPNLPLSGDSPFTFACYYGNVRSMRLLLDAGATFEKGNTTRDITNLGIASIRGHPEVVKLLLELGSKPNARDARRRTPLAHLAEHACADQPPQLACARLLLAAGANPKLRLPGGSPIDRAEKWGHRKLLAVLRDRR